jgi:two-component system, response regulator RegA
MGAVTPSPERRVLVVEDSRSLADTLERSLRVLHWETRAATTAARAIAEIEDWHPNALLLDVSLPDGTAFDVLERARTVSPIPAVVAISGKAGPVEAFRLAQLGVRQYLPKPLDLAAVVRALDDAVSSPPDLRAQLAASVGRRPILELEEEVRATMVNEALAHTGGNRQRAAGLLRVSRQLLQQYLRRRA